MQRVFDLISKDLAATDNYTDTASITTTITTSTSTVANNAITTSDAVDSHINYGIDMCCPMTSELLPETDFEGRTKCC